MKRWPIVLIAVIAAGLGLLWFGRGWLREQAYELQRPALPAAQPYVAPTSTPMFASPTSTAKSAAPPAPAKTRRLANATSSHPFPWSGAFPKTINLAVPFLSQAPKMDWSYPYQEACEEASIIMADAYLRGRTAKYQPEEGDQAILDLVAFEKKLFGYYEDTTAEETARVAREYFGLKNVYVLPMTGPDSIKRVLANGYPVVVPASGRLLDNPNFRNGGPRYHMLVVKGYLADGRWITNDPGTRKGADFLYTNENLMESIHDWNGGDVMNGQKVMIVLTPNR
jgi:hypothetical protein